MKQRRTTSPFPRAWLALGVVAVLVISGFWFWQSLEPTVATTTPAQAAARQEAGAFVLDVREQEEWNEFHIPGTTLIPLNELKSRLNEVPRDREIIVVCTRGQRSLEGAKILKQAGYSKVTILAGGLQAWYGASLSLVSGP